jgi:hypothetical protein
VINVGATPQGSIVVVDYDPQTRDLASRLESVAGPPAASQAGE